MSRETKFNWKKGCPNQKRVPTKNPLFVIYGNTLIGTKGRASRGYRVIEWECEKTNNLCSYHNRENDCPDNPLSANKSKKSGLINYLSSIFSRK